MNALKRASLLVALRERHELRQKLIDDVHNALRAGFNEKNRNHDHGQTRFEGATVDVSFLNVIGSVIIERSKDEK